MYLVGAAHPNKYRVQVLLEQLISGQERLATDVEVIQEILHRYTAINRREAIQPAIDALYGVIDQVISVDEGIALKAKDLVLQYSDLSARDALHAAVIQAHSIPTLLTFDRGFDRIPGIQRIPLDA